MGTLCNSVHARTSCVLWLRCACGWMHHVVAWALHRNAWADHASRMGAPCIMHGCSMYYTWLLHADAWPAHVGAWFIHGSSIVTMVVPCTTWVSHAASHAESWSLLSTCHGATMQHMDRLCTYTMGALCTVWIPCVTTCYSCMVHPQVAQMLHASLRDMRTPQTTRNIQVHNVPICPA